MHAHEFPFRASWRVINLAMVVLAVILALINIRSESYVLVGIWVFVGIVSVLQLITLSSRPAVRIDDDRLYLFRGPVLSPREISLADINAVERKAKRLDLSLRNGRIARFSLAWLDDADQDRLVQALREAVDQT